MADQTRSIAHQTFLSVAPFLIGGTSGSVATTCLQPIDMIKVRIQLAGDGAKGSSNALTLARGVIAEGGFLSLYSGLTAAYLRQFSYTTFRIGFFDAFLGAFKKSAAKRGAEIGFTERAASALAGGGLGAFLANPAEVALIRMQSDGLQPKAQRANYRSVVDALMRIGKTEGIKGLWKGSGPTTIRAMATNFGQLAFFSESKAQLKRYPQLSDQTRTFAASSIAGFFAAFFSLPFDFMKTRLQKAGVNPDGTPVYRGMMDCATQVLKTEGPLRFYRGFGMYFLRIAPHTIITLVVADNLKALIGGESF